MKERVFRYRAIEKRIVASRPGAAILDVGCGPGDNLTRLLRYGGRPRGIDPDLGRVRNAVAISPALVAQGEKLPWADESFEMVYISHVLHHATDLGAVMREARRVLAPGGLLMALETVEDSPIIRLARWIRPKWEGDDVFNRFWYDELLQTFREHGFEVLQSDKFNCIYFALELFPLTFRPFEIFTPLFVAIEVLLRKPLHRYSAHCWVIAQKPGEPLFPNSEWMQEANGGRPVIRQA